MFPALCLVAKVLLGAASRALHSSYFLKIAFVLNLSSSFRRHMVNFLQHSVSMASFRRTAHSRAYMPETHVYVFTNK